LGEHEVKTLLMLRHAKSSWDDMSIRDFDRPLAARGQRDAPRIGKALEARGPLPDLIVSSPAARAKETIESVIRSARLSVSPRFDDSIYGASSAELIGIIRRLPDESSCAMLVGHNPGFEDTVSRLTGERQSMPTAALACLEFQIERWEDVEDEQGKLLWLLTPKQLGGSQ
jgi:phosphohistidine phosphatase